MIEFVVDGEDFDTAIQYLKEEIYTNFTKSERDNIIFSMLESSGENLGWVNENIKNMGLG